MTCLRFLLARFSLISISIMHLHDMFAWRAVCSTQHATRSLQHAIQHALHCFNARPVKASMTACLEGMLHSAKLCFCKFAYTEATGCSKTVKCYGCAAATVGVVTETNAEKAIEELKAYEVISRHVALTSHTCHSDSAMSMFFKQMQFLT